MSNIITLQEYKTYKQKSENPKDDEKIEVAISAVSSLIQAYIGRDLTGSFNTPITETFSFDYQTDTIYPSVYPVRDVVGILAVGNGYPYDSTVHLPVDPLTFTVSGDTIVKTSGGSNWYWPTGANTVIVEYRGGYETAPDDVKLAAILLTSYYVNDEFFTAKTMGTSTAVSPTIMPGDTFPKPVQLILDRYK